MTGEDRLPQHERVVLDHPETQNLLGLLLQNMLEANLSDDATHDRVRKVRSDVQVQAGQMVVTLRLDGGRLTIISGPTDAPKARVSDGMATFLSVARGSGFVGPVLSGRIKVGGNLLLLLKLMPLLQVSKGD